MWALDAHILRRVDFFSKVCYIKGRTLKKEKRLIKKTKNKEKNNRRKEMIRTSARCIIRLNEPKRTNQELVSDINEVLNEMNSKFDLRIGGWNPKKQEEMEKWKIWDFNKGWIVGYRKKDKYLEVYIYMIDVLRALSQGKIGEQID
jgi:hypothetical protein